MSLKRISIPEIIVITLFFSIAVFIYIGFYFPDPYSFHKFGFKFVNLLLLFIRIGFPLFVLAILCLYVSFKLKKISLVNMILLLCSCAVTLLFFYSAGRFVYIKKGNFEEKKTQYHPYLQLKPPEIDRKGYDSNAINIVCLGGSTTEYTARDKRGWPERVEQLIQSQNNNKKLRVYNCGRQWYTSLHTLINYEVNIRCFKPDVIIVMHAINDLLQNADHCYFSSGPFREDYGHFYGPVTRIIQNKGFLKEVTEQLGIWYHKPRIEVIPQSFPGLASFKRNINTLIDLAGLDSTIVILMTQPYLYKEQMEKKELNVLHMINVEAFGPEKMWGPAAALNGMRAYNSALEQIAVERGVYFIDLEKAVPKNLEYFWDDVHYCEKTFDLIAEFIFTEINKQGVFDRVTHTKYR